MFNLRIRTVKTEYLESSDYSFLKVEFSILRPAEPGELPDGGDHVEIAIKSLGFNSGASEEEIKDRLKVYIDKYNLENSTKIEKTEIIEPKSVEGLEIK